jgi:D-alanine-D-alanine ligase-like ATP-grasp enzyme
MDVAFIALHGRFGEDGTVQKYGRPIYRTPAPILTHKIALDKIATKEVFIDKKDPDAECIGKRTV